MITGYYLDVFYRWLRRYEPSSHTTLIGEQPNLRLIQTAWAGFWVKKTISLCCAEYEYWSFEAYIVDKLKLARGIIHYFPLLTVHYLEPVVVASWHGGRSGVAIRATRGCRRQGRMLRAGYDYYATAVPGMMVPVADAAGKGDYQDSEYYC